MKQPLKSFLNLGIVLFYSLNSFGQSQLQINQDTYKRYQALDKKLNATYQRALKEVLVIDGTERNLIIETQKVWIKFRDMHCKTANKAIQGGTSYTASYNQCLIEMTEKRIKELECYIESCF